MGLFDGHRKVERLNRMLDSAIEGKPVETEFDESELSALESRFWQYLAANQATRTQLSDERSRIDRLIADISHQTKTPIANLLLYAQLLEERDLPDDTAALVAQMSAQAEKLDFLVRSLVKVSRLETGVIALRPVRRDVQPMLADIVKQVQPKAQATHIDLRCQHTETVASFDPKRKTEALVHIVDNAVTYHAECGTVPLSRTS